MWIVTSEYNEYNQEGEYFIAAYTNKPTFEQLKKLLGGNDATIGKLTRGAGREDVEELWFNLHEVKDGEVLINTKKRRGNMEGSKIAGMIIVGLILWAACMYGSYWVVKTLSYSFFYEIMVQETIRELVKPEFLK